MKVSASQASELTQTRYAFSQSPPANRGAHLSGHRSSPPRELLLLPSRRTAASAELRPVRCVETSELEPTPRPGATARPQQAATGTKPSQRPYIATLRAAEATLRVTARQLQPTTEVGADTSIQKMEWALQGIKHRRKFPSTEADRRHLTELGCSSEL